MRGDFDEDEIDDFDPDETTDLCADCGEAIADEDVCGVCGRTMCFACFEMGAGVCKRTHE